MPGVKVFVDSNVLLYSHDLRDAEKFAAARAWLEALGTRGVACTNLQVLNECAHLLLRKKWFNSIAEAFLAVDGFRVLGESPLTWKEVEEGRRIHDSTRYSW